MKKLGFLDGAGKPSLEYSRLKNKTTAKVAIAKGIRKAYSALFEANEDTAALPLDKLKGLVAQVSGTEEGMTNNIAYTFNTLVKEADFTQKEPESEIEQDREEESLDGKEALTPKKEYGSKDKVQSRFNPEFRFNIEIHLPSNGTEETYLAIFNALRKSLG